MQSNDEAKKTKPLFKYVILNLASIAIAIYAIFLLVDRGFKQNTATTPSIDPPVINEPSPGPTPPPESDVKSVTLVAPSSPLIISGNPYEISQYKRFSRQLALVGDFDTASLKIVGTLPTEIEHFLSINVGTESGVFNAVRNSANGLDISQTRQNQGIFDKSNPINISIDLMDRTPLATTASEFTSSRQATKLVRFWNFIKPEPPTPSVNRVLVAPFDRNGAYEGEIGSLTLEYSCRVVDGCMAGICGAEEAPYNCIQRLFGEDAAKQYSSWFKKTN